MSSSSAVCVRPRVAISVPRHVPSLHLDSRHVSSLHLPDVSRPPPGYSYPAQRTLYQSQLLTPAPSYNYEVKFKRDLSSIVYFSQPTPYPILSSGQNRQQSSSDHHKWLAASRTRRRGS